jgi:phospholipase/lecithinase/hemolysin
MRLNLRFTKSAHSFAKTFLSNPLGLAPANMTPTPARRPRRALPLFSALLFTFVAVFAHAQNYTSIVIFGDSLSDTGNVADLTQAKYGVRIPSPIADYTDGRFTDGTDTVPAAHNYFGVWVEQLAAMLPAKPVIKASLDGGTDYAYGFATTGNGTGVFTFGPSDALFVNVNNIGQQITDYLATKPRINDKTLFIVWGGAIDILNATSSADVVNAAIDQTANIQRLIEAGATQFIVPNLPPLGAVPRLNGSPLTSIPATKETILYNVTLAAGLTILRDFNPGRRLRLDQLDVFKLFNQIIASPSKFSLVDVTSSSQGIPTINPDTFLFWDDLHPTTRGHNILAVTADKIIAPQNCLANSATGISGWIGADCDSVPTFGGADQK